MSIVFENRGGATEHDAPPKITRVVLRFPWSTVPVVRYYFDPAEAARDMDRHRANGGRVLQQGTYTETD